MRNHSSLVAERFTFFNIYDVMKTISKHEKILAAAVKIFAKKGFFTARISDIAKEAKVADGTIYLYFNNKNEILLSIFDEEFGKLIQQVKSATTEERDPFKMLENFAVKHLQAMKKNKYLAELIQIELRQTNKIVKEYRNSTFLEYINTVADIIKLGQELNIFRKDIQPDIAKRAFFGALDEVSRVWNLSLETHYTVDEAAYQVLNLFLHGMKSSAQEQTFVNDGYISVF